MTSAPLLAYVGRYASDAEETDGGIDVVALRPDGALQLQSHAERPGQAGYLVWAARTSTLYAVDERKTDGRGPVGPRAAIHALAADPHSGDLEWRGSLPIPGPFPTYLSYNERHHLLLCASHGSFAHVERVTTDGAGAWGVDYLYDDSTVTTIGVGRDGSLDQVVDVLVLSGSGRDPNRSPQAGGHCQASPHAHCAVVDPSERYVLVCDKGTDQILVLALDRPGTLVSSFRLPAETAPRHLAFDPKGALAYVTCELSSELATVAFDATTGQLTLLDRVSTLDRPVDRVNEPAEVRVHPDGRTIYVNNRGEDMLIWFRDDDGVGLCRSGAVALAPSAHPGVAARSFAIDPAGSLLLVADRPAGELRSYAIDAHDGALRQLATLEVPGAAFVTIVAREDCV
ncbi:MAG: beta-propeller fold lactonase family protein [Actinomycetota bacterium]|nr:beta-propeller fold lactonase family protein [Actinomycetota bacterium]